MTARAAEALELAIWLHRVPARRAVLLGRPLPDGIGELLRVAPGAQDQVAAAALITGEPEETVLEAVRFYLQQILFHEDADAYRVLGLRPDAPQTQAREHHRLLQQWLHPDRRGADEWETVYASRVNRAWTQLRTPQSRAAYDQSLPTAPPETLGRRRLSGEHQLTARPASLPLQPPRNRSRTLTYVVLLGCVGLLVLIAVRQDRPPEWQDLRPSKTAAVPQPMPETVDVEAMAALQAAPVGTIEAGPAAPQEWPEAPVAAMVSRPVSLPRPSPALPAAAVHVAASTPTPARPNRLSQPIAAVSAPAPAPVLQRAPPPSVVIEVPVQALAVAVEAPAIASSQPDPVAAGVPDSFERMAQARDRARLLADYFGDLGATAPPVWNDLGTLHKAQRLRAELHRRLGMPPGVTLLMREPQWRLNAEGAWLDASYRASDEQGTLAIAFIWRADQLLVRSVDLVPDA